MKATKKCRAAGGTVNEKEGVVDKDEAPSDAYSGKDSEVLKEAKRKKGGKVEGKKAMKRLDRAPRKKGGRVGSEMSPFSAAAKLSNRPGGDLDSVDD